MTKHAIIERTVEAINQLPDDRVQEIPHFTNFVSKSYEEHLAKQ